MHPNSLNNPKVFYKGYPLDVRDCNDVYVLAGESSLVFDVVTDAASVVGW